MVIGTYIHVGALLNVVECKPSMSSQAEGAEESKKKKKSQHNKKVNRTPTSDSPPPGLIIQLLLKVYWGDLR